MPIQYFAPRKELFATDQKACIAFETACCKAASPRRINDVVGAVDKLAAAEDCAITERYVELMTEHCAQYRKSDPKAKPITKHETAAMVAAANNWIAIKAGAGSSEAALCR